MKKIKENEPFDLGGTVFTYSLNEGKISLTKIGGAKQAKKAISGPSIEEVKEYFKSKGYTEESAAKFHEYYSVNDWKDSRDKPVKNWKQKCLSVWFKPEYLIKETTKEHTESKFLF